MLTDKNILGYQSSREYFPEEEGEFLAQSQQFLNARRFAAILLSRGKFASKFPLEASYMLTTGLEHSYDKDFDDEVRVGRIEWSTLIPIATTWLLVAGKVIYEHCLGGDLYDGWELGSWNIQRWDLWKKQLGDFEAREDFNDECRDLASQTTRKMVEIEAGNQA